VDDVIGSEYLLAMNAPIPRHLLLTLCLVLLGCSDDTTSDGSEAEVTTDASGDSAIDARSTSDATIGDSTGVADVPSTDSPYCPVVGYEACGGDVVGRWEIRSLCPDDAEAAAALCESPYDDREVCVGNGNTTQCNGTTTGTFEFTEDGQVLFEQTVTMTVEWVFTDECLQAASRNPADSAEGRCANQGNERLTCTYSSAGCHCVGEPIVQPDSGSGTYSITDDEIQLGDDPPASYCVDGDSLIMDYYLYHPVSWRYWVFERE